MKPLLSVLLALGAMFTTGAQPAASPADSLSIQLSQLEPVMGTEAYLPAWYALKARLDRTKCPKVGYLELYRQKNNHHYYAGELDSMKRYVPFVQRLCLEQGRINEYYYQWSILADTYLLNGDEEQAIAEGMRMHEDAVRNQSEEGIAYSAYTIATAYISRQDYPQAEKYYAQALPGFYKMKRWGAYVSIAGNYINALIQQEKAPQAEPVFEQLDSLVTVSERSSERLFVPEVTVMVRGMLATTLYQSLNDTDKMRRYLDETEALYRKYPALPRHYLFSAKKQYASQIGDAPTEKSYIDSALLYYRRVNDRVALFREYRNMSRLLERTEAYEEALEMLKKHIELKDSIYKKDTDERLNKLSTEYNLNKLELDKAALALKLRNRQAAIAVIVAAALLIILILSGLYLRYIYKLNRHLKKQTWQLSEANREVRNALRMKNDFIQNMNHEIRTPLNAVVGFADVLVQSSKNEKELTDIAQIIHTNSDYLVKLFDDILYFTDLDSHTRTISREPLDAADCCRRAIAAAVEIPPHTELRLGTLPEGVTFLSDKNAVERIVANLLENALKFTGKGYVELNCTANPATGELRFSVKDTGFGIASEEREKIFDRFYKIDRFSQGVGLGLPICKQLAELLQGRITVEPNGMQGSVFTLILPLA